MVLSELIEALSQPGAYPCPVESVDVHQTHISAVFLAGDFVYKVKKPVAPGFLDFTTLEKRYHFCDEEVRLNRRLAPDVYLGVVPIVATETGARFEGEGEPIEWAVKMRRLPRDVTLLERLQRGDVDAKLIESLARRIAEFHRQARSDERIAEYGAFDAVAKNIADVLDRAPATSRTVVYERVRSLFHEHLARLRPLIENRVARGVVRDGHGDLHLDHVYVFPNQSPPSDLVIIDCIEFSESLRCLDPVADMAFVVMDLKFQGRRDLAKLFAKAYFLAAADAEGEELLPLFTAYRAAVRGMVEGLLAGEAEVPDAARSAAAIRSRAYWLLAIGELEPCSRQPALLLVGGMPGTGKSTVSSALGQTAGFTVIRSDVVRKEMAGLVPNEPTPSEQRDSLYSPETTEALYAECLARAEKVLAEGGRVIVDATFREDRRRRQFLDAAVKLGVSTAMLVCEANAESIRARLESRQGDASDADWAVYSKLQWEEASPEVQRLMRRVSTEGDPRTASERALAALRDLELTS